MILCGTDLSVASEPALRAAAAIARKLGADLLLVTVVEGANADAQRAAELRLEQDASELRRTFHVSVETVIAHGAPDAQLLELAQSRGARLIVVGAEGSSKRSRRLGSVPERLCQGAQLPVFVARDADNLVAWSQSKRPLRVLAGSGLGDASRSALEYLSAWSDLALTVAHVAWPYGEHYRLGVSGPMPLDHLRPEVHQQLLGDLGRWAAAVPGHHSPKLSVTPGWGRIDCHLAELAREKEVDLLVLGTHPRGAGSRLWHGSVSRNAIHEADCNVLCVPLRQVSVHAGKAPQTIVVPTDFSALGDRAIGYGYGLLGRGGSLHLVHVVPRLVDSDLGALKAQLAARIPEDTESRGISTELHVLESDEPWRAIWQQSGRASADLICLASHSRKGAGSLLLGSQAKALLQHSRVPVLIVPPDREG